MNAARIIASALLPLIGLHIAQPYVCGKTERMFVPIVRTLTD